MEASVLEIYTRGSRHGEPTFSAILVNLKSTFRRHTAPLK